MVGVGILFQTVGKKGFAISRNSPTERDISEFLAITKWQMDIELATGCVPDDQQKTTYHQSTKHGWRHYLDGFGMLFQIGGKMSFVT